MTLGSFRLWDASRVDVLATARAAPAPAVAIPEVGLRWGLPADFEHGQRLAEDRPGIAIERREPVIRIGVEVWRQYQVHTPATIPAATESVKNATFYLGPTVEIGSRGTETIHEYVEFDFDFLVAGERGTPPPAQDTPPEPSPKVEGASLDLSPFRTVVRVEASLTEVQTWRLTATFGDTALPSGFYASEGEAILAAEAAWPGVVASWTGDPDHPNFVSATSPVFRADPLGSFWTPAIDYRWSGWTLFQQDVGWVPPPTSDLAYWGEYTISPFGKIKNRPDPVIDSVELAGG